MNPPEEVFDCLKCGGMSGSGVWRRRYSRAESSGGSVLRSDVANALLEDRASKVADISDFLNPKEARDFLRLSSSI